MYCALQTHIRDDTVPHNFQCKWIFHVMQRTDETGDTKKGFVKFSSHIITIKSSKKIYHIFHFLSELLLNKVERFEKRFNFNILCAYFNVIIMISACRHGDTLSCWKELSHEIHFPCIWNILTWFNLFDCIPFRRRIYFSSTSMCMNTRNTSVGRRARIILHTHTANTLYLLSFNCLCMHREGTRADRILSF